jgi:hypothetical protein
MLSAAKLIGDIMVFDSIDQEGMKAATCASPVRC